MNNQVIATFSGRKLVYAEPRSREIAIEDIAHSLALQNCFLGHSTCPYSVAQHSLNCLRVARTFSENHEWCLQVLLHDAAKAYIGDTPAKHMLYAGLELTLTVLSPTDDPDEIIRSAYTLERRIKGVIANAFRLKLLDDEQQELLEKIDNRMCVTENMYLRPGILVPDPQILALPAKFFAERPYQEVEQEFLDTFRELISHRS